MAETNWQFNLNIDLGDTKLKLGFAGAEQSVLTSLRTIYSSFEPRIKALCESPSRNRPPSGLFDDLFALLNCLIYDRLQPHHGPFMQIVRKH